MANKVDLDIYKLGGMQTFEVITQTESQKRKYKYICSTWDGDGADNIGNYDILRNNDTMEYVALEAQTPNRSTRKGKGNTMKVYLPYYENNNWHIQETDETVRRIGGYWFWMFTIYGPCAFITEQAAIDYINRKYNQCKEQEYMPLMNSRRLNHVRP